MKPTHHTTRPTPVFAPRSSPRAGRSRGQIRAALAALETLNDLRSGRLLGEPEPEPDEDAPHRRRDEPPPGDEDDEAAL